MSATIHGIISGFISSMAADGIEPHDPGDIIPDGRLHRFRVRGDKSGSRNGWFVLHPDTPASGAYGSWRAGLSRVWAARTASKLNPLELAEQRRQIERFKRQAEAERKRQHMQAAQRANHYWQASPPASERHPYLMAKQIRPYIARQFGDRLALPIVDLAGRLHSLQFIAPNGSKRFLTGGAIAGHCIPIHTPSADCVVLVEGYATGCTVAQINPNVCVLAALNAGNLLALAVAVRKRWPGASITIVSDADEIGRAKAQEAGRAARAKIVVPRLTAQEIAQGHTDINDLIRLRGRSIASSLEASNA